MSGELLSAQGVEVRRGDRVVACAEHVSLSPSEVLALIGPNGAGKSTLLGVLALLFEPTSGQVFYRGAPVPAGGRERLALRRRLGCVFQEPLLLDRSAAQNVALPLELRGVPKKQAAARADEWLRRLRIFHVRDQNGATLSGGEAQRVSLARTLIVEPEAVFLDEPLAALDTPTRERFMTELPGLLSGRAALLVTHDHGEARRLASRVAVMMDGRLVQQGAVDEVFQRPASVELARFLGVENLLPARGEPGGVELPGGQRLEWSDSGATSGDVVVCLRAESVRLGPPGPFADDICLRGRVVSVEPRAMGLAVKVELGGFILEARAWPGDSERYCLEAGAQIELHFHGSCVHVLPACATSSAPR